jgi:hypothetical protein
MGEKLLATGIASYGRGSLTLCVELDVDLVVERLHDSGLNAAVWAPRRLDRRSGPCSVDTAQT